MMIDPVLSTLIGMSRKNLRRLYRSCFDEASSDSADSRDSEQSPFIWRNGPTRCDVHSGYTRFAALEAS